MTFVYLICFLLVTVGILFMLKLTPEKITNDLMRFVSPKQTLRDKVLTAKGKKKSRKLTVELNRIRDALEQTGKGGQFTIACATSILLMIIGCVVAIMIDNAFLIPVFAIAFALIPFAYAKRTVNFYDNHIKEELETALSIITTSYVRTDDIVTAVKENVQYLKPPVKDIFAGFVAENMMISSDVKQSIRHLKEKVSKDDLMTAAHEKYKKQSSKEEDEIPSNSYPYEQTEHEQNYPASEKNARRPQDVKIHRADVAENNS